MKIYRSIYTINVQINYSRPHIILRCCNFTVFSKFNLITKSQKILSFYLNYRMCIKFIKTALLNRQKIIRNAPQNSINKINWKYMKYLPKQVVHPLFSWTFSFLIWNRLPRILNSILNVFVFFLSTCVNVPFRNILQVFNWVNIGQTIRTLHQTTVIQTYFIEIYIALFCWMR